MPKEEFQYRVFVVASLIACFIAMGALAHGEPLLWPVQVTGGNQYISSQFGLRQNPQGGGNVEFHTGLDIACRVGTPLLAAADGTVVVCAQGDAIFGAYMMFQFDNGMTAIYGHMSETWYPRGTRVKAGQVIGLSGNTGQSTGPHVHFALYLDPMPLFAPEVKRSH